MKTIPLKKWRQVRFDQKLCQSLAVEMKLPEAIIAILLQRGMQNKQEINSFFNSILDALPSPSLMLGMEPAVNIICDAISHKRPVFIYGDYDVDGTTGVAVLTLFLRDLGLTVSVLQPNRFRHGYGLNSALVTDMYRQAGKGGAQKVLITVDCGISDHKSVVYAKQLGFSVIITDHHQPPPKLPEADAIINPLQPNCRFPFKYLAGVGVAFYLVMGLRTRLTRQGFWQTKQPPNLKKLLDLVALGTVADMVEITGVNRILVKAGLEVMGHKKRTGIAMLAAIAGCNKYELTSEDIGYRLGPRLNAAGRMGNAAMALDLLLTSNKEQGRQLAFDLDQANSRRKTVTENLFAEGCNLATKPLFAKQNSLVLFNENWHQGVLGIVASRMTERFHKPTILLTNAGDNNELIKGSGRSVAALDLHKTLNSCHDLLVTHGGHRAAVGLTMKKESLDNFRKLFEQVVSTELTKQDLSPAIQVNWQTEEDDIYQKSFLDCYLRLSPFGIGNPEPVFSSTGFIKHKKLVGQHHLKFSFFNDNGTKHEGIGFGLGMLLDELPDNEKVEILFKLQRNNFGGKQSWQLNAMDIRKITP